MLLSADGVACVSRFARAGALAACLTVAGAAAFPAGAQETGAAALANSLDLLRHDVPRVLHIAAHPDDEDQRLFTLLSRGGHAEVAYLSLNRGEGGQNLVGEELGEALGVLRTQELLAARRVDGAHQYFTRAYDFGYSKSAEEAFSHWPRDSLLADMVRIVRAFRPHVITATFSGTPRDQHGQHQVSGILARDVYEHAGDSLRFPVVQYGLPWTPLKLYRLAAFNAGQPTISLDAGQYDPLSGRSFAEVASDSRSQHKSQGYRQNYRFGEVLVNYRREATRVNGETPAESERSLFDGLPEAAGLDSRGRWRDKVDLHRPATALPVIAAFDPRGDSELIRYSRAGALAAGLRFEALAARPYVAAEDTVTVMYSLYNRGTVPVTLRGGPGNLPDTVVAAGSSLSWSGLLRPTAPDEPWWLARGRRGDLYAAPVSTEAEDQRHDSIGHASLSVEIPQLRLPVQISAAVVHRSTEPPYGDLYAPLRVAPGLTVTPGTERSYVRSATQLARQITVIVRSSFAAERNVSVSLRTPAGLAAVPAAQDVRVPAGGTRTLVFELTGRLAPGEHLIQVAAQTGGSEFNRLVQTLEYPHVPPQRIYREAIVRLTAVDIVLPPALTVGYVRGMADAGPKVLGELGIPVTLLDPADIPRTDLSRFTSVVIGPRAYEANGDLVTHNQKLFDYVGGGGRLVVQFGQYPMDTPGILPFPITITRPPTRVTDENAPVTFVDAAAPELNYPNRITQADFAGWVQERATFMPTEYDSRYRTVLAMNDPGEDPKLSSILVAPIGRGAYVYTTLALFREFVDGVPGAARLFVNLISPAQR